MALDLVEIRMILSGGKEVAAEADLASESIANTGKAATKANEQSAASAQKATGSIKKTSGSLKALGRSMTHYITLPLLAIGAASVDMAAKFDRSVLSLHTQAGVAKRELKGLRKEFLAISRETTASPLDVSEAGYRLAGAGLRGRALKEATKSSAQLAMVGHADTEATAKTLGQVWYSEIAGSSNFQKDVAELNATVGAGDLRLEQLVDALGTGVPKAAAQAGLDLHEVNATMAVFGDTTNNVSGFAAQFATGLHYFTAPGKKASEALQAMGLDTYQLSEDLSKPNGLVRALSDLRGHLEALPGGIKGVQAKKLLGEILPGGRGRVFGAVLLESIGKLEEKEKTIADTTKNWHSALKETEETPMVRLETAWSNIQADLVELGNTLIPIVVPALEKIAGAISSIAGAFKGLSPQMKTATGILITTLAAVGPLIGIGGRLGKAGGGVRALATGGSLGFGGRLGVAGLGIGISQAAGAAVGGSAGTALGNIGSGAAAGFAFGGPWGALAGGGAGALLTILPALFSSTPKISIMRRETEHLGEALKTYKSSLSGLDRAETRAKNSHKKHTESMKVERRAATHLAEVLAQYGPHSHAATKAQRKLSEAERSATHWAKAEERAHKLVGFRLKEFRIQTLHAVASIKQLVPQQKHRIKAMREEVDHGKTSVKFLNELEKLEGRVAGEKKKLIGAYSEAESKAGKPWAERLHNLTGLQAKYGEKGKTLVTLMGEQSDRLESLKEQGLGTTEAFKNINRELQGMINKYEKLNEIGSFVPGEVNEGNLGKGPKAHRPEKPKKHGGAGSNGNEKANARHLHATILLPNGRVLGEVTTKATEDAKARL